SIHSGTSPKMTPAAMTVSVRSTPVTLPRSVQEADSMRRLFPRGPQRLLAAALAIGWTAVPAGSGAVPTAPSCPQTSTPTSWVGTALDVNTTKSGTVYNSGGASLELNKAGAVFNTKQMTTAATMVYAAV